MARTINPTPDVNGGRRGLTQITYRSGVERRSVGIRYFSIQMETGSWPVNQTSYISLGLPSVEKGRKEFQYLDRE